MDNETPSASPYDIKTKQLMMLRSAIRWLNAHRTTTRMVDNLSQGAFGIVPSEYVHLIVLTLNHVYQSLNLLKKDWPIGLSSAEANAFLKAYGRVRKLRDALEHTERELWFNSTTKPPNFNGVAEPGWVLIRGIRVPEYTAFVQWESGLGPTKVSCLGQVYDMRESLLALNRLAPILNSWSRSDDSSTL